MSHMYTNHEIGKILHKAETIDDFLSIQIELLENVEGYLQQFTADYFNFIGVYCMEAIPRLIEKLGNQIDKLACFHFLTTLFYDFKRFYKEGGATYFKTSVASIEDKLKSIVYL
ncbi:hypothetical protein FIA58_005805 [Flavobacterium jejuense]|uniref:Uncharacterized protein n=1 Tax=Flavobacterium jejuense TaxID=1544455 RepID=A0ABX0IQV4_9FLAO|nr:hypothetical protein [Flavobacterium jejuense]NHN25189.1 hypothetical protein [Flavobacterium jejuense]